MFRYAIPLLAVAAIGCQSNPNNQPAASNPNNSSFAAGSTAATQPSAAAPDEMNAERAAYAARAQYPIGQPTNDLHLTALVDRNRSDQIQVINPTDKTIDNTSVWVNGKYVTYVAHIPAHSVVKLDRDQFYDNAGHKLSEGNTPVNQIHVQLGDRLFNVMGPAYQ